MSKAFASKADLADKKITFEQLSAHCWAYTAEGDPNSGVIIGENAILVSDATATPALARDLIARIRTISDKPIKYVLLTHYHAVRVLGASAFKAEGVLIKQFNEAAAGQTITIAVLNINAGASFGVADGTFSATASLGFNNNGVFGASANLTWDGTYLTAGSIKDSALTSGRLTYAGASGLLPPRSSSSCCGC